MDGPQSFAPAKPGTERLDPILFTRNKLIEETLLSEGAKLLKDGDLRWYFTTAHGEITRLINKNLAHFQRPNALMRLNIHFAEEFVRALWGQPHEAWKNAFKKCAALQKGAAETSMLVGEVEFCGAAMATVHIHVDLTDAIKAVGCIPPADYGNMLVFVKTGALIATIKLRGMFMGVTETIAQEFMAPFVNMEVKAWRNASYQDVCHIPVPDPNPVFRPDISAGRSQ